MFPRSQASLFCDIFKYDWAIFDEAARSDGSAILIQYRLMLTARIDTTCCRGLSAFTRLVG
jgi:hypothetical protein